MEIDWKNKYNEALERARALREEAIEKEYVNDYVKDYEAIFPELAESEDERIREELIGHCKDLVRMNQDDKVMLSIYEPWLAWLEKQKPEWSEEDERILVAISKALGCDTAEKILVNEGVTLVMAASFLESLRYRPKQEWSKEDEKMVETICEEGNLKPSERCWLKSLKNRGNSPKSNTNSPSWKPSEEQMGALNYAYCELFKRGDVSHNILGPLQNLIDTLRKL